MHGEVPRTAVPIRRSNSSCNSPYALVGVRLDPRHKNEFELHGAAARGALPAGINVGNRIGLTWFSREADELAAKSQRIVAARIGEITGTLTTLPSSTFHNETSSLSAFTRRMARFA